MANIRDAHAPTALPADTPAPASVKPTRRPGVHPRESVGEGLRAVARTAIAEARTAITDPALSGDVAVHDFRKSMKRWRAILRLVEPFLGPEGKRLRVEARDFARELAGARDARIALDALADATKAEPLAPDGTPMTPLSARSLATIADRLQALQAQAEGVCITADTRGRIDAILYAASESVKYWPLDDLTFRDLADEFAAHYRAARRAIPHDWASADPEALHVLRQRVVTHRYQVEIIAPLWPRFTEFWIAESQRLRDRLGQHQDLMILTGLTAPRAPLAPWRSRLVPAITVRRAEHVAGAARLAGRLFAETPKAFRRRLLALWDHRAGTA